MKESSNLKQEPTFPPHSYVALTPDYQKHFPVEARFIKAEIGEPPYIVASPVHTNEQGCTVVTLRAHNQHLTPQFEGPHGEAIGQYTIETDFLKPVEAPNPETLIGRLVMFSNQMAQDGHVTLGELQQMHERVGAGPYRIVRVTSIEDKSEGKKARPRHFAIIKDASGKKQGTLTINVEFLETVH